MDAKTNVKRNIPQFTGDKYAVWKFRLTTLLAELDVLTVISDELPENITDQWKKKNIIAKSTLIEYLGDSFLSFAEEEEYARDIVHNLDALYERKSLATQLSLRKRLLTMKLEGDRQLLEHFTIFDELVRDLISAGAKLEEMDKVSHLLLTLPTAYDGIITALETITDDITLAFVKTRLLDYEVKLRADERDVSMKVLSATTQKPQGGTKRKFRNSWKSNFKKHHPKDHHSKSNISCDYCGRKNHIQKNCYFYKKSLKNGENPKTIQAVQTASKESTHFAFMFGNKCAPQPPTNAGGINFLLDSGATDHVVNQLDVFTTSSVLATPIKISVAKNDTSVIATRRGTIEVITEKGLRGTLEDVLYAPQVPYNLLSVSRIQGSGLTVVFDHKGVTIKRGENVIIQGKPSNGLTRVEFKLLKNMDNGKQINLINASQYKLWHERLGHMSKINFQKLKLLVDDVAEIKHVNPTDDLCEACIYGKQTKLPFAKCKIKNHVTRPLFRVHSDLCGPITPPSLDDKNYFVSFIDDFTHYTVTYLIKHKSDVVTVFKDYVSKSEVHFNLKLVTLYCDNGREFLSNEIKNFCAEKGITYHLTVTHTPQQNGVAERMNRTIIEKARAMLISADLSKEFWGEAVNTAVYLINLSPTRTLQDKTPYELWHNKKPRLKYLRIFGSTAFIHNKDRRSKFDKKSSKGILVGYEPSGYKVWDSETHRFRIARDVIVDEQSNKMRRPFSKTEDDCYDSSINPQVILGRPLQKQGITVTTVDEILRSPKVSKTDYKTDTRMSTNVVPLEEIKSVNEKSDKLAPYSQNAESDEISSTQTRKSERIKKLPKVSYNECETDIDPVMNYDSYVMSIFSSIPNSYDEIKNREDRSQWEHAIKEEIDSLEINKTWSLVIKPENKNIVDCKWVFTIKNNEFGNPIKYKARLVARGFSQQYKVDYEETFAPVARLSTFRFLMALSNQLNLLIHHMDVKTAFLNGVLKEEIYMKVPQGVKAANNKVCKLNRSLYGLKQSSRCWFELFDTTIKQIGFQNSAVDRCLYILNKKNVNDNIYLILYVDDLVIATKQQDTMSGLKTYLMKQFSMVDLKDIKLFLGINIERTDGKLMMNQTSYLTAVLNKFNMSDCKAVSTPLPLKLEYDALNVDEPCSAPCRNLIGCLMYAMLCTRPDLCTALNILSRYQSKSNSELWKCLKRVLRYVKGTLDLKLTYNCGNYEHCFIGFADSDWGNNESDRKSTSGYLFQAFNKCTISWNTKRQNSVAASSTEAEYMALFECVREAIWLKSLCESLNIKITKPIPIFEDNNGCISIANNPVNHKRSKHIDIKYHFSREKVEQKLIIVKYVQTGDQLADIFTKPLAAQKFMELRFKLGLL